MHEPREQTTASAEHMPFFSESHHFPVLGSLLQQQVARGPVSLWSAGCAGGAEPYSMAIAAIEALGDQAAAVSILASDPSEEIVERAQRGIFTLEHASLLGEERLKRFFLRGTGTQRGHVRIRPEVRQLLRFRTIELRAPDWPVRGNFGAIFCRHTLGSLDEPTQRRVLRGFAALLGVHGLLFAGPADKLAHCADLFSSRGNAAYAPVPTSGQSR